MQPGAPYSAIRARPNPLPSPCVDERAKELSRLYERVAAQVKAVVDRADPAGLFGLGAPPDEYDDAVEEFTRRLLKGEPTDSKTIEDWFVSGYGIARSLPGRDAPFRDMADGLQQIEAKVHNDRASGSRGP